MKRVLVTGATGGLGRNAVEALLAQGAQVRATGRNAVAGAALQGAGAQFEPLDLATATDAQWQALLQDIDVVWHCAALSSPWGRRQDFVAANVTLTARLLQAAGDAGVQRFVHISTPAIYFDFTDHLNIAESFRPQRYVNDYAATKAEAEACVQQAVLQYPHMRCIILRPRAIFGPHDQVLLPRLRQSMRGRAGYLPLPHAGQVTLDLTYVGNVVQAMQRATTVRVLTSGAVFNITNHAPAVLGDVLTQLFAHQLQLPLHIVRVPYPLLAGAATLMQAWSRVSHKEPLLTPYSVGAIHFDMTLDNTQALNVLGYQPVVDMQEGIRRTADWWRAAHG